jgi:ribonucleotide monophosphatase NagD (HAD superfamily)
VSADREYALRHGVAPTAADVVAVDFDGTIFPFVDIFGAPEPMEGAVDALKAFKEVGFRIVILTSRLSQRWLEESGNFAHAQYKYVANMLDKYGIPWDEITAEKVPAAAYIDDRAIPYSGSQYEWAVIRSTVIFDKQSRDRLEGKA